MRLPDSNCFVLLVLLLALETYFRFFIKFKSKRWRTMTLSPMTLCTLQLPLRNLSWSLQISRQGNPTPKAKRSTKWDPKAHPNIVSVMLLLHPSLITLPMRMKGLKISVKKNWGYLMMMEAQLFQTRNITIKSRPPRPKKQAKMIGQNHLLIIQQQKRWFDSTAHMRNRQNLSLPCYDWTKKLISILTALINTCNALNLKWMLINLNKWWTLIFNCLHHRSLSTKQLEHYKIHHISVLVPLNTY